VLRNVVVGLGNKMDGTVREDHFVITVASEIMAVLCLAEDMEDMKKRLGRMVVAYNYEGKPVTAGDLQAVGAMAALLRDAMKPNLIQTLEQEEADLVVLAGYLVILPEILIQKYQNRIINIHPSLIPSFCGAGYYGLKVHEAVLARGVKLTGATVHFVDQGTDTGPIILQQAVEVKQDDTPQLLQQRVMEQAEWKILPKAVGLIANGKVTVSQGKVLLSDTTVQTK